MIVFKHIDTGNDLYYIQREPEPGTQHLDRDTATLVTYDPADWADYVQALTEDPAGGYIYKRTHAVVTQNPFIYDIYKRLGTDPAITDALLATIYGFWDGSAIVYTHLPLTSNGLLNVNMARLLGIEITSFSNFMAPAQPIFQVLPSVRHGATSVVLRIPVTRKDGELSGGGLTYDAEGLFIAIRPNNDGSMPTYTYSAFDSEIEELTTPGVYQAPLTGKACWGFVSPAGMYELHLENDIFSHTGATNLTIMIAGNEEHAPTVCEVPLVQHDFASLASQINLLPEASTTRVFADETFDYDLTGGTYISGTIANTQSTVDPPLVFSPSAEAALVVEVQFDCSDGFADVLEITGRVTGTGGTVASREVSVWAFNDVDAEWVELSTGGTRITVSATDQLYSYVLQPQFKAQDTGTVRIQFRNDRLNAADRLYLDRMDITVLRAGISVAQIVHGVHYTPIQSSIVRNGEHNLPAWFWWQIRPLIFNIDAVDGNVITCSGSRFDASADYIGHTLQFHLGGTESYRFAHVVAQTGDALTVDDIQDVDDTWHGYILTNRLGEVTGLTTAQEQLLKDIAALVLV